MSEMARGLAALREGRWLDARADFEAILREWEAPEALAGLGDALFWLGDARGCVEHRERAYAAYRRLGDVPRAAESAIWLCLIYGSCLGNRAAARGWVARVESLLGDDASAGPLLGWVDLCRALYRTEASDCRELLDRAIACGRSEGDFDLELCALAELGVVLVKMGEIDAGLQCVDEAMAGALGGEREALETVVMTSCSMLTVCDLIGDLERATEWTRVADDFTRTYGGPYLYYDCRTLYARILVLRGRWAEAEAEIAAALAAMKDAFPGMYNRTIVTLAGLRVRQGRADEAQALIDSIDAPTEGALVRASLALRRGEAALARALVVRWLGAEGDDVSPPVHAGGRGHSIETASALCTLFECELAGGDMDAARAVAERLESMSPGRTALTAAHAAFVRGCLAEAEGDVESARKRLEEAIDRFARLELPLEAARAKLCLATVLSTHQPELAVASGREALAAFDRLQAMDDADAAAALLRKLGVAGRTGVRALGGLTRREQQILGLIREGLSNKEIAARLYISRKTAAHHASNLFAKLGVRNRAEAAASAARAQTGEGPGRRM